jgi:ketosteroid isomerase-like protein
MRMKDLDRLMALYSPDVVYFDVVPPLRYVGSAALRARFAVWFDGYAGAIDLEVREVTVAADGALAVAHRLSRASGTLKNGRSVGSWVRASTCCRRGASAWLITHEHVSLPVSLVSGSAATDLLP